MEIMVCSILYVFIDLSPTDAHVSSMMITAKKREAAGPSILNTPPTPKASVITAGH